MAFFEIDSIDYTDDFHQSYWTPSISSVSNQALRYYSRVLSANGIITSMSDVESCLSLAKLNNYYKYISGWFSSQFGWRTSGSNRVIQWFDLSSEEKDYYANIQAWQPVWYANQKNSKSGISFDGGDDNMRKDYNYTKSIFLVFKSNSTGDNYKHILGDSWGDTYFHGGTGTNQWYPGIPPYSTCLNFVNGTQVAGSSVQKTSNYTILTITHYDYMPVQQLCWAQNNYGGRAYPGTFLEIMYLSVKADSSLRSQIESDINSRWAIY